MGQVFNKGLDVNERQEGLFKRLKNIEDKTDNQLKAIESQKNGQSGLKSIGYAIRNQLLEEAIKTFDNLLEKIKLLITESFVIEVIPKKLSLVLLFFRL